MPANSHVFPCDDAYCKLHHTQAERMPSLGYIPKEGVWTAEERAALTRHLDQYGIAVPQQNQRKAIRTVAALIAACSDAREILVKISNENLAISTPALVEADGMVLRLTDILEALR